MFPKKESTSDVFYVHNFFFQISALYIEEDGRENSLRKTLTYFYLTWFPNSEVVLYLFWIKSISWGYSCNEEYLEQNVKILLITGCPPTKHS